MDWLVAPFDQTLPVADEEVSVTPPPWQNVVGPLAVIDGVAGSGVTVVVVPVENAEAHPSADTAETLKVPAPETVIDCVVAPFDHR